MDEHRNVEGVLGDLEHAAIMLGSESKLYEVCDYSWSDLMQLSDTLRTYTMGRELVEIRDAIGRIEESRRPEDSE